MTRIVRFRRAALSWSAALGVVALAAAGQALAQTPAPAPAPAATPTAPRPTPPRPRVAPHPHPQREQAPAAPEAPPPTSAGQQVTRIPPPGPAEVPLFPARDYTDTRTNMSMTVPAGWLVIEAPVGAQGDISRLFIEGPGSPPPSCTVVVIKPQQPPNINQPLINRMLQDERNVASVRNSLGAQGRRIVSIRKVVQNGIAGIVAQVLIPGSSTSPDVTTYIAFFEAVGKRFSFNCTALTNDLDTMRPDIEAMFRSLKFN